MANTSTSSTQPNFGQTAVELGYVSQATVESTLAEQAQARSQGPTIRGAGPIGALLVANGALSAAQAAEVLRRLAGTSLPLSEDGIRLAARLKVLHAAQSNIIGIAGTMPQDVAQLAAEVATGLAVMEQGEVLALEADPRHPMLAKRVGAPQASGFLDAVAASQLPVPLPTAARALHALPVGGGTDAASLAMSPQAAESLKALRERFRYIVVQLGDLLRHPEAAVAASRCDGVALVVRAQRAQKAEVVDMRRLLLGLDVPVSGVVLARAPTRAELRQARAELSRT
jgi:Mrp family chromosome partitioning ATPase